MAAQIVVLKEPRILRTTDVWSVRAFERVPNHAEVVVNFQPRKNPKQVRLYFALLDFARQHALNPLTGETMWKEDTGDSNIKTAMKYAVGAVSMPFEPVSGRVLYQPHSVKEMNQIEFDAFFERAVYVLTERWMPEGTTPAAVRAELMEMIEQTRNSRR